MIAHFAGSQILTTDQKTLLTGWKPAIGTWTQCFVSTAWKSGIGQDLLNDCFNDGYNGAWYSVALDSSGKIVGAYLSKPVTALNGWVDDRDNAFIFNLDTPSGMRCYSNPNGIAPGISVAVRVDGIWWCSFDITILNSNGIVYVVPGYTYDTGCVGTTEGLAFSPYRLEVYRLVTA